jgi:maleamate amidohydrolase
VRSEMYANLLDQHELDLVRRTVMVERDPLDGRLAILVIDAQNYMVGPPRGSLESYPSACGEAAETALARLSAVLVAARARGIPVIYTQFTLRRDGADIGVYGRKRDLLPIEGWCIEGTEGALVAPVVAPALNDIILVKKKPSGFHGTPMLGYLVDRGVDTVIITGGSTSNCVRATAVDSASLNFRTIVVSDCVFDRFEISHRVALFDMSVQQAELWTSEELLVRFAE